jgi:hypothetical protein
LPSTWAGSDKVEEMNAAWNETSLWFAITQPRSKKPPDPAESPDKPFVSLFTTFLTNAFNPNVLSILKFSIQTKFSFSYSRTRKVNYFLFDSQEIIAILETLNCLRNKKIGLDC